MEASQAKQYNYNEVVKLVRCFQGIVDRINKDLYPSWMIRELNDMSYNAQCIMGELKRDMTGSYMDESASVEFKAYHKFKTELKNNTEICTRTNAISPNAGLPGERGLK